MSSPPVVGITGASSGVGRATAIAFARQGAKVGLVARGAAGLEGAARDVADAGGEAFATRADVASMDTVVDAVSEIEARLGPIDIWVNNAMVTVLAPIWDTDADEFRRVTEVTYLGAVHGTMAALARMRPRDRGTIVQVGSALAYRAIPLQSAYCGAKHALQGFTESVRCELLHERSGVRLTMVQLPALNTPQFDVCRTRMPGRPRPVAPVYQPEVAADAIVWAAFHPRREHWVGGTTAATILGNRLVPGLLDRYLARTGFRAQQDDEPVERARRDNLYQPLPGDAGVHGRFGDAWRRSIQARIARLRRR